jgi:hypothetical protein
MDRAPLLCGFGYSKKNIHYQRESGWIAGLFSVTNSTAGLGEVNASSGPHTVHGRRDLSRPPKGRLGAIQQTKDRAMPASTANETRGTS